MRRAQQRKRRLLEHSRPVTTCDDDHNVASSFRGRRRRSRTLKEGNSTTLMLVMVVSVFLAVELPQAVTLILLIAQYTFSLEIFARDTRSVATLMCNLVILLSYPTNFFIYCAMSRAFRTTFAELVCSPANRRLCERRTTATQLAPTGRRFATNADEALMSNNDAVILAEVDGNQENACIELIEENNETCL